MFDAQDLPAVATQLDSPPLPIPGGTQPVHLLDRLSALFKHRRLAGAAFVLVVGVMMMQAYSQVPMFRTSARVIIQDERSVAIGSLNANDPMYWQDSDQYNNTPGPKHPSKPRPGKACRPAAATEEPSAVQRYGAAPSGLGNDDCGCAAEGVFDAANGDWASAATAAGRSAEPRRGCGRSRNHQPVPRRRAHRSGREESIGRHRLRIPRPAVCPRWRRMRWPRSTPRRISTSGWRRFRRTSSG